MEAPLFAFLLWSGLMFMAVSSIVTLRDNSTDESLLWTLLAGCLLVAVAASVAVY